jgi:hypothetical protein
MGTYNRPSVYPGPGEEVFVRGLDAVEEDSTFGRAFVHKDLAFAAV